MKKYHLLGFALLLLHIPMQLCAQQNPVLELTLEKAIDLALEKNGDIKVAGLEVEKSDKRITETRGYLLPSLDISGQYVRNIQKPVIFLPPGPPFGLPGSEQTVLEIGYDNAYTGTISASLPLFMMSVYKSLELAKENLELSKEAYRESVVTTVSKVKKAFYSSLLTRALRNFMRLSYKDAQDNLENVRRMHKQGLIADYDLIKAEVEVENIQPLLMQSEDNYQLAKDALKISIGLNAEQEIEVKGELQFVDEGGKLQFKTDIQIPTMDEAMTALQEQNTTLRKLSLQSHLTETNIELAEAEFYPSLVAFGNFQYLTQANDFGFSNYNWVKTSMVGIQLQVPLFRGLSRTAKLQQAKLTHLQLNAQQYAVTEAIKTKLRSVLYRLNQTKKRIETQEKSISQAEKGYKIAQSRYENGMATLLEVNDARVAQTQARFNYAKAVYDFLIAYTDYEELIGETKAGSK